MCGQYTLRGYSPCVFTIAGNGSNGNAGEESLAVWEGDGEGTYRKEAYKEKKRKKRMCSPAPRPFVCVFSGAETVGQQVFQSSNTYIVQIIIIHVKLILVIKCIQ